MNNFNNEIEKKLNDESLNKKLAKHILKKQKKRLILKTLTGTGLVAAVSFTTLIIPEIQQYQFEKAVSAKFNNLDQKKYHIVESSGIGADNIAIYFDNHALLMQDFVAMWY
ncbi:hypothetical protein ACFL96_15835 [Thermoproteota archaeon]